MKTSTGYFKTNYMVLTNQELYLYSDKDSIAFNKLIIMSPGVFVKGLNALNVESASTGDELRKLYPIELYVGGQIVNIGVANEVNLSRGSNTGTITLFLETQDKQHKWIKFLEESTGSYNIKDYYIYNLKTDKNKKKSITRNK